MVQAGVGIAILPVSICQRPDKATLRWLPLESDLRWQLLRFGERACIRHTAPAWLTHAKGFGRNNRKAMGVETPSRWRCKHLVRLVCRPGKHGAVKYKDY